MQHTRTLLAWIALALAVPAAAQDAQVAGSCLQAPFSWRDRNVLWLGTSIPAQGVRTRDSYPDLFCQRMGCRVLNNAVGGSRVRWDEGREDESCHRGRNAPKGLSATRRELRSKMDAALPDDGSSSYHPSCRRAIRPGEMGYEDRINVPWSLSRFDAVVLDHGHNDRPVRAAVRESALGTLNPTPIPLTSVQLGRVTRLALGRDHGLQVNDDITVRTPGLPRMDYWTGEVAAVEGDAVLVNFNSSGMAGAYTGGGSVVRYDKSKLYDAYNLVISDILHMNALHGGPRVPIVLVTPPSEWARNGNDGSIANLNQALGRLAAKWGLPLYDMTADLQVTSDTLRRYLPDGTHPSTRESREVIAERMARWAEGTRLSFDACAGRWVQQPPAKLPPSHPAPRR